MYIYISLDIYIYILLLLLSFDKCLLRQYHFFLGMILKHKECSTEISIEVNHLNH